MRARPIVLAFLMAGAFELTDVPRAIAIDCGDQQPVTLFTTRIGDSSTVPANSFAFVKVTVYSASGQVISSSGGGGVPFPGPHVVCGGLAGTYFTDSSGQSIAVTLRVLTYRYVYIDGSNFTYLKYFNAPDAVGAVYGTCGPAGLGH